MYDYRENLKTIIDAIGPDEQSLIRGVSAIEATLTLVKLTMGTMRKEDNQDDEKSDNKDTVESDKNTELTEKTKKVEEPAQDNDKNEQIESSENQNLADSINNDTANQTFSLGLTSKQYDAIQKFKAYNEAIDVQLRDYLLNDTSTADLSSLKNKLENYYQNQLNEADRVRVNAYFSMVMQHLNQTKRLINKYQAKQYHQTQTNTDSNSTTSKSDDEHPRVNRQIEVQTKVAKTKEEPVSENTDKSVDVSMAEAVKQMPDQSESEYQLDDGQYIVRRCALGSQLLDKDGRIAYYFNERQTHDFGLKAGDVVEVDGAPYDKSSHGYIKRIVDNQQAWGLNIDGIVTFNQAVVEEKHGKLVISRNINQEPLIYNGSAVEYQIDTGKLTHVHEGDIADLAWYEDTEKENNPQSDIYLRWVYPFESDADNEKHATAKPAKKKQSVSDNKNGSNLSSLLNGTPKLKMDLRGQVVGIAIGNGQNSEILKSVVESYNGRPKMINAFMGKRKTLRKQIKGVDMLVMITAYANHSSSWKISESCRKFGIRFSISTSFSIQSFGRALYRAENGLPAYESSNQVVNYPMA